jgi:hypothetical protein
VLIINWLLDCTYYQYPPFQTVSGETVIADQNYASSSSGDYPLHVSEGMSKIETGTNGLIYTSNSLAGTALVKKGGELNLSHVTLSSKGPAADTVYLNNGTLYVSQGSISTEGTASWGLPPEIIHR